MLTSKVILLPANDYDWWKEIADGHFACNIEENITLNIPLSMRRRRRRTRECWQLSQLTSYIFDIELNQNVNFLSRLLNIISRLEIGNFQSTSMFFTSFLINIEQRKPASSIKCFKGHALLCRRDYLCTNKTSLSQSPPHTAIYNVIDSVNPATEAAAAVHRQKRFRQFPCLEIYLHVLSCYFRMLAARYGLVLLLRRKWKLRREKRRRIICHKIFSVFLCYFLLFLENLVKFQFFKGVFL